jgi:hypothetical protein
MSSIDASASGQFRIGDITVNRLGYGAMRITGRGIWGAPSDRHAALATLRRLAEIGVTFFDTADSYGPDVSETLIREALHPYEGLLIATKAGLTRPGPDQWRPDGRPAISLRRPGSAPTRLSSFRRAVAFWRHRRNNFPGCDAGCDDSLSSKAGMETSPGPGYGWSATSKRRPLDPSPRPIDFRRPSQRNVVPPNHRAS